MTLTEAEIEEFLTSSGAHHTISALKRKNTETNQLLLIRRTDRYFDFAKDKQLLKILTNRNQVLIYICIVSE